MCIDCPKCYQRFFESCDYTAEDRFCYGRLECLKDAAACHGSLSFCVLEFLGHPSDHREGLEALVVVLALFIRMDQGSLAYDHLVHWHGNTYKRFLPHPKK